MPKITLDLYTRHIYNSSMKPTPHNVNQLYAKAVAHHSNGRTPYAVKIYKEILTKFPNHTGCRHNLARLLMAQGLLSDSIEHLDWLIANNQQDQDAVIYRADVARLQHDYLRALALLDASDAIRASALALNIRALILRDQEQFQEAMDTWGRATDVDANLRTRHQVNAAHLLLLNRDYANGFRMHEARAGAGYGISDSRLREKQAMTPRDTVTGSRVLLHWEQGLGDTIQFMRYATEFKQQGADSVTLVVQPELVELARQVPGVDHVVTDANEWPVWTHWLGLMSAPWVLGTLYQTVPWEGAYVDSNHQEGGPRRVGVCWSGGLRLQTEELWLRPPPDRDVPQDLFLAWVDQQAQRYPHVEWVSLQAGRPIPKDSRLTQPSLVSWADTQAVIDTLDLVITVDTSVAHLAGAMARPTWLLNRRMGDWRWASYTDATPWYPTVEIFRQTAWRDWQPILEQVSQRLAERYGH